MYLTAVRLPHLKALALVLLVANLPACLDSKQLKGSASVSGSVFSFEGLSDAAAIGSTKIQLKFPPATGCDSDVTYKVYRDGEEGQSSNNLTSDSNGHLVMLVTSLKKATSYKFNVQATCGSSTKEDGNTARKTATTMAFDTPDFGGVLAVVAPSGLSGTTSLKVMWDAATPAASTTIGGYNIFYGTSADLDFSSPSAVAGGAATSHTITGLSPGTEYFVAVHARDNNGIEEKNEIIKSEKTNTSMPISFAGAIAASNSPGLDGFTKADVTWLSASGDFDHYKVYVSTTNPGGLAANDPFWATPNANIYDTTKTSHQITGLTAKTNYYIVVRAANSINSQNDGNVIVKTARTEPPVPSFSGLATVAQPSGVSGLTTLTLTWPAASGAFNRYQIFQKAAGVFNFGVPTATASAASTSHTVSGLTTGTTYCFIVRAVYDAVTPLHTETNSIEICGTPTYIAPTFAGVASCAAAAGANGIDTININWTAGSGIFDQYAIWVSTSPVDFNAAATYTIGSGLTTYAVSGLTPNTSYTVGVRAKYTGNGAVDGNTVMATCSTNAVQMVFTQVPTGAKDGSNRFVNNTQVCYRDSSGNTLALANNITLSKTMGAGVLGGTLVKAAVSGCATYGDLTYTVTDTMKIQAASAVAPNITTGNIVASSSGAAPGACATSNANWYTAYGGCYAPAINLVVGTKSPTTINGVSSVWEAKADLSDVEFHDNNDGDGDARPDETYSGSTYKNVFNTAPGFCHDMSEGGYNDWRTPNFVEMGQIRTITGFMTQLSFVPGTGYYWAAQNDGAGLPYQGISRLDISAPSYDTYLNAYFMFCIRTPEPAYATPTFGGLLTATTPAGASGSGAADLTWNAASGSYNGYYIFYAPVGTGIDFAVPQVKIKSPATSYRVTGLLPNTNYEFAVRAAYSVINPIPTDGNSSKLTLTTRPAHLEFALIKDQPLTTSKIALIVRVIDDTTSTVYPTSALITLTQVGGTGSASGTLSMNAASGVAKFSNLIFNDFTGTGTVQIQASSAYTPPITSALLTIKPIYPGSCKDFSLTTYPERGGCYYSNINLTVGSKYTAGGNTHLVSFLTWESGVGPGFAGKEASDTADGDADGKYDDLDPTNSGGAIAGSANPYCHDATEGGKTDWRMPTKAEAESLNAEQMWLYSEAILTDQLLTSHTTNGLNPWYKLLKAAPPWTDALNSCCAGKPWWCVRANP